jgi:adenylate cyclase
VAISSFWVAYIDLISAYGWKGMQAEARGAMAELDKLMPGYTVQKWASADWSDNPTFKAEYARIVEGLRKAGLREG